MAEVQFTEWSECYRWRRMWHKVCNYNNNRSNAFYLRVCTYHRFAWWDRRFNSNASIFGKLSLIFDVSGSQLKKITNFLICGVIIDFIDCSKDFFVLYIDLKHQNAHRHLVYTSRPCKILTNRNLHIYGQRGSKHEIFPLFLNILHIRQKTL